MRFTFKHLTGSRAGQEQVLEGRVVNIGRNPSNLLAFDPEKDDRVSGNHAQILVLDDGKVVLSDLGSRNGTLVNGQKIMGQLPLGSGTTVQFGSEGGPEVQITYGAAPVAAPAAAQAPAKGGNGCKIAMACLFLLLLLGCVIGGVVMLLRPTKTDSRETDMETVIATTDGAPTTEASPTEAPPATEKPAEPPKVTDERTAWGKLGVGSRFEQKSVSEMKVGETVMKSETVMVYTVKSNDGKDVVVTLETSMDIPGVGPQKNASDTTFPAKVVKAEPTDKPAEEPEKRKDKVTVPAGTFDCTVWTTKTKDAAGAETVTENFMGDLETDPLPYKTVMKSPTMNMVMELVKAEKK
jgi:pSer/pThr/pTyr-binding forkhead associated (FHA) protein